MTAPHASAEIYQEKIIAKGCFNEKSGEGQKPAEDRQGESQDRTAVFPARPCDVFGAQKNLVAQAAGKAAAEAEQVGGDIGILSGGAKQAE